MGQAFEEEEKFEEIDSEVFREATRVSQSKDDLRVMHVTKAFGSNVAVEDVSFGVPKGEVFALLGPNGAGKVSILKLSLSRTKILRRVLVNDHRPDKRRFQAKRKRR